MDNQTNTKIYQAALYARRKFLDIVQPDEPDPTAVSQIRELKNFLTDYPDIHIAAVYMDNRRMKKDAVRKEFLTLMEEFQNGKFDCLVVSSFELFGRDHIENQYYLLDLLCVLNVRIISLHDNYDSLYSEPDPGKYKRLTELIADIKKLALSRTLSTITMHKMANSFLALSFTPYGYLYNPDTVSNLDIDPEAAPYVQFIFKEFLAGTNRNHIARKLTEMNVASPSLRKKQLGISYTRPGAKDYWTFGSINYILKNQAYTGDLVFGKQRSAMYVFHECKRHKWTGERQVVENHHEALVTREEYDQVQILLELMFNEKRSHALKSPGTLLPPTPFRNMVFCGHCGRSMYTTRNMSTRNPYVSYICSSYRQHLPDACPNDQFRMEQVIEGVKEALLEERQLAQSIYRQMSSMEPDSWHDRIEQHFQSQINSILEQVKRSTVLPSTPTLDTDPNSVESSMMPSVNVNREDTDGLRKTLTGILKAKQQFRKDFTLDNPWLVLFQQLPETFEVTKELAKKYIFQVHLYRDRKLEVTFLEDEKKQLLLSYLALIGERPDFRKETHNGTEKPPEPTAAGARGL